MWTHCVDPVVLLVGSKHPRVGAPAAGTLWPYLVFSDAAARALVVSDANRETSSGRVRVARA